jgi:hypothetical protein
MRRVRRTALLGLLILTACVSSLPVPKGWDSVPAAAATGDYCAAFKCAAKSQAPAVHIAGNRIVNGDKARTPEFAAIDSFDVSLDRKEIVFSARRKDNFDIGLVSLDGSDIHWIPEDPADEVSVQWAPRGNKVSFILHTKTGSIVRTVHIPTATQLSVDFPQTQIDALAWEPQAERFAVVAESPDTSKRIVSMTYEGVKRQEVVAPSSKLDVEIEPMGGVLVMRPNAMRYNERLPLVVWLDRSPFAWSDARAALMRNARVAIAIAPEVNASFWSEIAKVTWIDSTRTYVVNGATGQPGNPATVIIKPDPALPPNRYARHGNTVSASPAVVQSLAAAFIADDLKGTPPPNGRRR